MTPEEKLIARRERVKQFYKEGRVMNDKLRKQQKAAIKYQTQLEDRADIILAGLVTHEKPKKNVVDSSPKIEAPTEATTKLTKNVKSDRLASAANAILKELRAA